MKIFDVSWPAVLEGLSSWCELDREARRRALELKPSRHVERQVLGSYVEALEGAGLVVPVKSGRFLRPNPERRELLRVLRGMDRQQVFDPATPESLARYVDEHFSHREVGELLDQSPFSDKRTLVRQVSSRGWLLDFLESDPAEWRNRTRYDPIAEESIEELRSLCRRLIEGQNPLPLHRLLEKQGGTSHERLGPTLHQGLACLLLFGALEEDELLPVVGVWPPVARALRQAHPAPPRPVKPETTTSLAPGFEDMTTLLVECAAQTPRLTSYDELYAAAERKITSQLAPLPEWLEGHFALEPPQRLRWAMHALRDLAFVEPVGTPGRDYRLQASPKGERWLALAGKKRLRSILDSLKKSRTEAAHSSWPRRSLPFLPDDRWRLRSELRFETLPDIVAAYSQLPRGDLVSFEGFLLHQVRTKNPVVTWNETRLAWHSVTVEDCELLWRQALTAFFVDRLLAFGGIEIGQARGELCFGLTDVGRYLLDLDRDFSYSQAEGEVLVQPNFEVVFLAPSPRAEATFGRFCERKSNGVGTLFNITRRSVLNAAAGGLSSKQILQSMAECSAKPLPENVRHQIEGWLGQTRRLKLRSTLILTCPDQETAARVVSLSKKNLRLLTNTIVEIGEDRLPPSLTKKLKDAGLFIDEPRDRQDPC